MARRPSGAVASILEKDGTKKTIFFDFFTPAPAFMAFSLDLNQYEQAGVCDCQGHVTGLQKATSSDASFKTGIVYN